MSKRLIVVQGAPGVGKTTLATKLARDLGVQLISKDILKEALYETIGDSDNPEQDTQLLGRAAIEGMYEAAHEYIRADLQVMIESPLEAEYAIDDITKLVPLSDVVQIHVWCDPELQRERFAARLEEGRHHAHSGRTIDPIETQKRNAALPGIDTVSYDTSSTTEEGYHELLNTMKGYLQ